MTLEKIAEHDVVTANRDDSIGTIVEQMDSEQVGAIVVEDDTPIGIITDRMIALSVGDETDPGEKTADDLMTEDLVTVSADDGMFEVIRTLSDAGIRRVPIVDEQDSLTGIISFDDLIVLLADELEGMSTVIEQQAPRF